MTTQTISTLHTESEAQDSWVPMVAIAFGQVLMSFNVASLPVAIGGMVATFNVPQDDRFQVVTRHPPGEMVCAPSYLGIAHTERVVFIQITCNEGRTLEMKKALFAQLASSIADGGAIRAADVIVSLVEVKKENWSFGNGLAQYAT